MTPKTLMARDPALLSEAEWSSLVVELARLGGWELRYHTLRSKGSASGFPDWVFVKDARILFVELKSEVGLTTPKQDAWLEGLRAVGEAICGYVGAVAFQGDSDAVRHLPSLEVYVWRPSDFEAAAEVLTGRPARTAAA